MKKIGFILMLSILTSTGFAQVQRVYTKKINPDSAQSEKTKLKELNLTKTQRGELKELNQQHKAAKDEIENDTTLTDIQKKQKLKELKRQHKEKMNSILTDDQKAQLKQRRGNKKGVQ
ncbi:MAG: hypothetical protein JSU03_02640 [Bacteroidetes bacterium]|nr:hypothetical protein [Bacteroidota bacterium]MBS1756156.1 hypothetical protein [Bacteroidota bacterium]